MTIADDHNIAVWEHEADLYGGHTSWNDEGERRVVQAISDEVRGQPILEVGVGAGRLSWMLGLLSHDFVGVDYSPSMVAVARRLCPWADMRIGDVRRLDFADGTMKLVFFSNAGLDSLGHADRAIALAEMARVLQPNGILVYSTLNRDGTAYKSGPGPVHPAGSPPDLVHIARFAARAALRPGEHLAGIRNIRRHAGQFEDHGSWAVDTMPTHRWELVVHFVTPAEAHREAMSTGFDSVSLFDHNGVELVGNSPTTSAPWLYVVARQGDSK